MADKPILILIAGFVVGMVLFVLGFKNYRLKRLIEDMPTSKIRSLAMGLVEIKGEAMADKSIKTLKSPFTNKDCVYYKYKIEEYHSDRHGGHWVTVKSGSKKVKFYLKDDTGKVLVDPAGANVDIPQDYRFRSGIGKSIPEDVQKFCYSINFKTKGWVFRRNLRFTEWFIEPKDKLYILGTAGKNPEVEMPRTNVEGIMIQKGKFEKVYYIFDKSEKDLLKSFKWKSTGFIVGGIALSAVCLGIFLSIFL